MIREVGRALGGLPEAPLLGVHNRLDTPGLPLCYLSQPAVPPLRASVSPPSPGLWVSERPRDSWCRASFSELGVCLPHSLPSAHLSPAPPGKLDSEVGRAKIRY